MSLSDCGVDLWHTHTHERSALLGLKVSVQLRLDITHELEQSLHRFVLVCLNTAVYFVDLLSSRVLNLRLHVATRTKDLNHNIRL